jgi:hypothetical protein
MASLFNFKIIDQNNIRSVLKYFDISNFVKLSVCRVKQKIE